MWPLSSLLHASHELTLDTQTQLLSIDTCKKTDINETTTAFDAFVSFGGVLILTVLLVPYPAFLTSATSITSTTSATSIKEDSTKEECECECEREEKKKKQQQFMGLIISMVHSCVVCGALLLNLVGLVINTQSLQNVCNACTLAQSLAGCSLAFLVADVLVSRSILTKIEIFHHMCFLGFALSVSTNASPLNCAAFATSVWMELSTPFLNLIRLRSLLKWKMTDSWNFALDLAFALTFTLCRAIMGTWVVYALLYTTPQPFAQWPLKFTLSVTFFTLLMWPLQIWWWTMIVHKAQKQLSSSSSSSMKKCE